MPNCAFFNIIIKKKTIFLGLIFLYKSRKGVKYPLRYARKMFDKCGANPRIFRRC